jgi:hypothetical protein
MINNKKEGWRNMKDFLNEVTKVMASAPTNDVLIEQLKLDGFSKEDALALVEELDAATEIQQIFEENEVSTVEGLQEYIENAERYVESLQEETAAAENISETGHIEKGQRTKTGNIAALIYGGAAGILVYQLYKRIRARHQATIKGCSGKKGQEYQRCMLAAKTKEIKAKQAAIKRGAGKAKQDIDDPKRKAMVDKRAAKEIAKLNDRLTRITKTYTKRIGALGPAA